MNRLIALVVFLASAGYLAREFLAPAAAPPPPPPPTAEQEAGPPLPILTPGEIQKVRDSLQDQDPEVRWSAIRLLHNIHDPELPAALQDMLSRDPDPEVRVRIVGLLRDEAGEDRLAMMIKSLDDPDPAVRVAALRAIGDGGDPSATPWVTARLSDAEPSVRIAALKALGRFHDRRVAAYDAMAKKLRADYEAALKRRARR